MREAVPTFAGPAQTKPALLTAHKLRLTAESPTVDLDLHAGQIVGLAGLEGHGQERFLQVLAGVRTSAAGQVLAGERAITSAGTALAAGIAYLPRDRKTQGIFPTLSILDNFAIPSLRRFSRAGWLDRRRMRDHFASYCDHLGIVAASSDAPIVSLSGGNQQKVILARWLAAEPAVLLLNDATRGVDLHTRRSLYEVFRTFVAEGGCVVLLSTEIEELLEVADRIVVFREDGISAELGGADVQEQHVLAAMFGQVSR